MPGVTKEQIKAAKKMTAIEFYGGTGQKNW